MGGPMRPLAAGKPQVIVSQCSQLVALLQLGGGKYKRPLANGQGNRRGCSFFDFEVKSVFSVDDDCRR